MENLIEIHDLGVPLFLETPILEKGLCFPLKVHASLDHSVKSSPFDMTGTPSLRTHISICILVCLGGTKGKTIQIPLPESGDFNLQKVDKCWFTICSMLPPRKK